MKCLKDLRVIVGAFVLMLFTGSTNGMMSGAGKHSGCCKPQSAGTVLKAQQGQRLPKLDNPEHLRHGQQPQLPQPQLSAAPEQVKKVGVIKKFFGRWQAKRVAKAAAQKKAAGKKNKNKHAKK